MAAPDQNDSTSGSEIWQLRYMHYLVYIIECLFLIFKGTSQVYFHSESLEP